MSKSRSGKSVDLAHFLKRLSFPIDSEESPQEQWPPPCHPTRGPYPKQRHAFNGAAHLRPVRLHDDGGDEEGEVRVLPLHGLPRLPAVTPTSAKRSFPSDLRTSSNGSRSPPIWRIGSPRAFARTKARWSSHARTPWPMTIRRRHTIRAKLDRGYDDYLEGRISEDFWTPKSSEWESEMAVIDAEMNRLSRPTPAYVATGEKILELAKNAYFLYSQHFDAKPNAKAS